MALTSAALASLDEALTAERVRLERVLFRFVVLRLAGTNASAGTAGRLARRLQEELDLLDEASDARDRTALAEVSAALAQAPEPYRTMLTVQVERFDEIRRELTFGEGATQSNDPFDELAAEIALRAARGALAGGLLPELALFLQRRDRPSTMP